jgi:tetratricopeptide (TPR) repeat protein
VQEGNAYRILPVYNPDADRELVNTEVAYENMMKKFQFRGLDNPDVYYTQDYRSFVQNHRSSFNALAEALIQEGDNAKAREVLLYSLEKMPDKGVRYDFTNARMVELLLEVGEKEKALEIVNILWPRLDSMAEYYLARREYGRDLQINLIMLGELQKVLYAYGESDLAKKIEDVYNKHAQLFQNKGYDPSDF